MKSKVEETLGKNLRRLRELRGVSQTEMSKIAGVSQKTVSNLENRETEVSPKLQTIIRVADYFKVHPGILLTADLTDDSLTNREVSLMLERFAQLLIGRVMHPPIVRLKTLDPDEQTGHAAAVARLFDLDVEDATQRYLRKRLPQREKAIEAAGELVVD